MAIVDALDRKRRDIAREIAEFRTLKEKEFIAFEQQLRAAERKFVNRDYPQQQNAEPEQKDVESLEKVRDLDQGQDSIAVVGTGLDTRGERHLTDKSNRLPQPNDLPNGIVLSGTEPAKWPPSVGPAESHEREDEFHGVFTPSYLPLLDGSTQKQKDWPGKPALKISIVPRGRRSSLRNSATGSSSASFPPSTMSASNSPPTTRHFSTSAPRQQASHPVRRSSSSDASAVRLRSSLRNPSQPRSPKRVLFSIDNLVVSPSTSPETQKKSTTASKGRVSGVDHVPRGFERVVAGKSKETQPRGSWEGSPAATAAAMNRTTMSTANRTPITYPAGPYQSSSVMTKPRGRNRGDEFVSIGLEDDMFTFDEDLDLDELPSDEKPEGSAGSEDDEEGSSKDEPIANSPHAGSLPIEIKWPTTSRRDRIK